jgi:hypothetical protein
LSDVELMAMPNRRDLGVRRSEAAEAERKSNAVAPVTATA